MIDELRKLKISNAKELLAAIKPEVSTKETLKKLKDYDTSGIETLLDYCKALGVPEELINFDPSLARGLDYYTGIIYEVVSLDNSDLGSLCAGGRYDNHWSG